MDYVQPVGAVPGAQYIDADPSGGIEGSPVPAAAIENPMRELVALIMDAGLAPSNASLTQVANSVRVLMQKQPSCISVAGGTNNAITGSYTPAITALSNGLSLYVRIGSANTVTAPTFTPNSGTIAAKGIVKGAGYELVPGDIAGAGHWIELRYDLTLDKWVLLNPATGVSAAKLAKIQPISASVASNAMTVGLAATNLDFRSSTLSSGVVNTRAFSSNLSLTIPSGATLGTVSGMASRILILAIDNAGTVELAVYNIAGAANLDETGVISTTAISAAADSSAVYSQTARTNVPYRIVGYVDSTQGTAGTWASAPTAVQGIGGQALTAMSSIGYGQSWIDVSGSRVVGTTYYNTTGRPIMVDISGAVNAPGAVIALSVNGVGLTGDGGYATGAVSHISAIIPIGASYSLSANGGSVSAINNWSELR